MKANSLNIFNYLFLGLTLELIFKYKRNRYFFLHTNNELKLADMEVTGASIKLRTKLLLCDSAVN